MVWLQGRIWRSDSSNKDRSSLAKGAISSIMSCYVMAAILDLIEQEISIFDPPTEVDGLTGEIV